MMKISNVLLPAAHCDLTKWAVVACDQYTSEPAYWEELESVVGDAPSALRLVLPEVWLGQGDAERIDAIHTAMQAYLDAGLFRSVGDAVLTERTTESGTRTGLVTAIDLEDYTYEAGVRSAIRATERTVVERIPPRVAVRRGASLELPHVMMLLDDRQNAVLGAVQRGEQLYDFACNMGGGHLAGWSVVNADEVAAQLEALLAPELQCEKYGVDAGLALVVGDGNHSLASAKAYWDEIKSGLSEEERAEHPARFALVEIVNLYDEGIVFEPIHRAVFGDVAELPFYLLSHGGTHDAVGRVLADREYVYSRPADAVEAVAGIDELLAAYAKTHDIRVDYVHGDDSLAALCRDGAVGIFMPKLEKSRLFDVVAQGGVLPKKTFSMGEAHEKRYYLEARRITK